MNMTKSVKASAETYAEFLKEYTNELVLVAPHGYHNVEAAMNEFFGAKPNNKVVWAAHKDLSKLEPELTLADLGLE
jgi:hypothetical protein